MSILQMSGMGTVLICLILLLRKLAGERLTPGCYLILWLLAGIRLLIPFSLISPFSVYQLFAQSYASQEFTVYTQTIEPVTEWFLNTSPVATAATNSISWIVVLWLVGVWISFFSVVVRHWRHRTVYCASLPIQTDWILAWQRAHTLHRKYQIRQCQQITTPLTYGVICPVILLPANQDQSDAEVDMMLLHEWNHIRHWDVLWQWLLTVLCSVHWFNPAVWLMSISCRKELELFCDHATVCQLPNYQRKAYTLLLLRQSSIAAPQSLLFSSFCSTGYHRMEERVNLIMKQKPLNWKMVLATTGVLCTGCLCFAASAAGDSIALELQSGDNIAIVQNVQKEENLYWPVASNDGKITANYGERVHPITGENVKVEYISIGGVGRGTDLVASASGVVKEIGFDATRGNYVILQCDNGLELHYLHCETLLVKTGDSITALQTIATLGQSGSATGPCLSFAVYQEGEARNPLDYLN